MSYFFKIISGCSNEVIGSFDSQEEVTSLDFWAAKIILVDEKIEKLIGLT